MVVKITPDGLPQLGMVEIATTQYGGHPPEFWAERLVDNIREIKIKVIRICSILSVLK